MADDPGSVPVPAPPIRSAPDPALPQRVAPRVVGIGASAGGLQAFTDFVRHMAPNSGLAFVLVQHLAPQQPSLLPELLAVHTAMPVRPAVDQTMVEPNHVYLIPPNTALTIAQGVLHLAPPTVAHGQRLPIDHFFRSLAVDQGPGAVGIVLSGTGADGSLGLAAIRAGGGLTLAQTPASAAAPAMPQQAINHGVVDYVCDIAAMPALLLATPPSATAPEVPLAPNGDAGRPALFRAGDGPNGIYQGNEPLACPPLDVPQRVGAPTRPAAPAAHDIGSTITQILLHNYAPTAVAIDAQGAIVHLSGRTHPYLTVPEGAPTTNLLAMAHPDLHLPLRTAIRRVLQKARPVVRENLSIATADGLQRLTLTVRPLRLPSADPALLLVLFQANGAPLPQHQLHRAPDAPLAQEAHHTRNTLETTIRNTQTANQDLTAVNAELRTLNEELQVTNEEFQTSKEEIQSINEELQTVNAELSRKIAELDRANADLANLFASTQIPTIFLRADEQIARFTPQATALFALIESDVGRPLSDIKAHFQDDLHPLIAQVLQTMAPVELVVHQPEQNRWWSLHIRPYRTLVGVIDGVVLTFADITTLKRAEVVLQEAHDVLERRVAARTQDLIVTNAALQAQIAERACGEQVREQLLQQLVTAQEEERRHLARELHDQMGQDLTALILGLKALQAIAAVEPHVAEHIVQLQVMAVQIGEEVRRLAVQLRPSVLDDLGLALALNNYVEQWSARAHVAIDLHSSGLDGPRLPLAVETTIYRLVQEALTNVLKHAQASEVSVIIERRADEVRLIVEDDGVGFTLPPAPGVVPQLGLIGMQERVVLLGGTLTIEAAPGSGTTIFGRIPLSHT